MQWILRLAVILSWLCATQSFLDPIRETTKKLLWAKHSLDYIKENCPLGKEYDDILLCYCAAYQKCRQSKFFECAPLVIIAGVQISEYTKAACPRGKTLGFIKETDIWPIGTLTPQKAKPMKCTCLY